MMFLDPCLFMPLSRAANIIFYFGSSAERDLAAACKSHCSLSHLCVECVSATEHHAASCLTFSFVSSVSLPQNITLHPVSPFPLYPACLCHGMSRCILWVSTFPLYPVCLCHGTSVAARLAFSFVSSVSLPWNTVLHPVSLNFPCLTFSSVSCLFLLQTSCCILWVSPFPLYLLVLPCLYVTVHSKTEFFIHVDIVCL